MRTKTQTYCIVSDVKIKSHDTEARFYWAGDYWSDDVDSSFDYTTIDAAKRYALAAKNSYPVALVQILSIKSETESELIDIY